MARMDETMQIDDSNAPSSQNIYDRTATEIWPVLQGSMSLITGQDTDEETIRLVAMALFAYRIALLAAGVRVDAPQSDLFALLKDKPDLVQSFRDAYHRHSFSGFLSKYNNVNNPDTIPTGPPPNLVESFRKDYVGQASEALVEYLTDANKLFHSESSYYAKILPIVQASGTGKSRMLLQLFKHNILVIYICLRDPSDALNYPERDTSIADLLQANLPHSGEDYLTRCYLVLAALFKTIYDWIDKATEQGWEVLVGLRAEKGRREFFNAVEKNCKNMSEAPVSPNPSRYNDPEDSLIEDRATSARAKMRASYTTMITKYAGYFPRDDSNAPQIVIAFDEAHTLSTSYLRTYKPSYYLCTALSDLKARFTSSESVWVLFASTNSRISHFAAPSAFHDSLRVAEKCHRIITPFTLTGWDQFAPSTNTSGIVSPSNVASFEHLKGFGRPLWNGFARDEAMPLAEQKLVHSTTFKAKTDDQALAVLSQRFALDVAFGFPEAVEFMDLAIASYMRICLSVTSDRVWRFTSYPSEPVLSSAAASLLHQKPTNLVDCLQVLNAKLHSGMIDKGQRGELVSRVLLLLGRDYTLSPLRDAPDALAYCQPVKVLDYLKTTFGDYFQDPAIQNAFEMAYINFTHWLSMKENLVRPKSDTSEAAIQYNNNHYFGSKDFLLNLWLRTAAIQCAHNQPDADKVAPVYFDIPKLPPIDRMSSLLDSDKLRKTHSGAAYSNLQASNQGIRLKTNLPSISITCDMGLDPGPPEVTFRNNILGIHVKGVSMVSFPFMTQEVENEMKQLVSNVKQTTPKHKIGAEVAKKFEFGKNTLPDFATWE